MTARLFREGDTLIGHFACGVRLARVTFADRHSDALAFVDARGRELGPLAGAFTIVARCAWDALAEGAP